MIYRIVTEDKQRSDEIAKLVLPYFEGFSISEQVGYYKGSKERSIVIEIDTLEDDNPIAVQKLAIEIRELLGQECVLVQKFESKSKLI